MHEEFFFIKGLSLFISAFMVWIAHRDQYSKGFYPMVFDESEKWG